MSLVQELLSMVRQEMHNHGASKLLKVRVKYGALSQVVPDSMEFAFEVLTKDSELEGAEFELVEIPMLLRCFSCKHEFTPETANVMYNPCPACGEEFGHEVLSGKELYLDTIEAE